ncbi:MAG: adenylate/guanylate cyclase domain-containing protein [Stappiaceae bacterium]
MSEFYDRLTDFSRTASPSARNRIEAELWEKHGVEQAVFILDLSGFSKGTDQHGIVHFLALIQQMRTLLKPLVEDHRGDVVKFEADNCFARFSDPLDAVRAAVECNQALSAMNERVHRDFEINASVGIDFGWILLVKQTDYYGMPVNIASKLGEDTARPGQILVTDRVIKKVGSSSGFATRPHMVSIYDLDIEAHEILY